MENQKNTTWRGPDERVAEIFRCIDCQGRLKTTDAGMACRKCGREYPFVDGVLRIVDAQEYAGSLGFPWLKHNRTQLDTRMSQPSELYFTENTGLRPEGVADTV